MGPRREWPFLPVLPVLVVVATCLVGAQQPPEWPLRLRETVVVAGLYAAPILSPAKCDARGNLYVRFYERGAAYASPVLKISREAKVVATFAIRSAQGFESATAADFTLDPRGRLYFLSTTPSGDVAIVVFDPEGHYDSTIQLKQALYPGSVAVFASGEFLISGTTKKDANQESGENPSAPEDPFTAIFDRNGRLIKQLTFPEDIQEEAKDDTATTERERTGSSARPARPRRREFQKAIFLGQAVSADDGYVYLMRATPKPLIYVITPAGTVLRRLEITPPSEGALPGELQVARGKLALMFAEPDASHRFKRHILVLANAETGEILSRHPSTPEVGGELACYTPDGFVFFGGSAGGQFAIRSTYPQ